jgi:hypothetical protein
MEDKTTTMQQFEQFAKEKLNDHKAELDTRYENQEIDKETLEKANVEHTKIFNQEMDEKIKELSSGQNDQRLNNELQNQKKSFLSQLSSPSDKN